MRVTLSVLFSSAVVFSTSLNSQSQPDFSGIWAASTDAPRDIAVAPSPVFGPRFAIAITAGDLILTRLSRDGAFPVKLAIDGAETRTRIPGRLCESDSERVEKVAREGGALAYTLVGTVPPGGGPMRPAGATYRLRLEGDGLVVQGVMVQQGQSRPVATVYKRSTESLPLAAPVVLPAVKTVPATIALAEWIGGTWIGSTTNVTVEERWTPSASGAMLAIGRTLRGSQPSVMASFEFLCIVEREGSLAYTAMPNGRSPATYFMLTSITPDSLTFENPGHDYPKLIRYTKKPDGTLETTISAGGSERAQSFVLKRQ